MTFVHREPTIEGSFAALDERLANLERLSSVSLVSSLPTVGIDGEEVVYQNTPMATAGVAWRLRYREASTSTHKWEFVGGSDANTIDGETHSLESAGAFSTQSPNVANAIEIPISGDYDVWVSLWWLNEGAAAANFVAGAAYTTTPTVMQVSLGQDVTIPGASAEYISAEGMDRVLGFSAGKLLTPATQINNEKQKYKVLTAQLRLRPIRVG